MRVLPVRWAYALDFDWKHRIFRVRSSSRVIDAQRSQFYGERERAGICGLSQGAPYLRSLM